MMSFRCNLQLFLLFVSPLRYKKSLSSNPQTTRQLNFLLSKLLAFAFKVEIVLRSMRFLCLENILVIIHRISAVRIQNVREKIELRTWENNYYFGLCVRKKLHCPICSRIRSLNFNFK